MKKKKKKRRPNDDDYMLKKTKYKRCDVFFYFRSSITIKLKCFSNIIVIGSFNRISDIL